MKAGMKLPSLSTIGKVLGAALAAYGVNVSSLRDMTLGTAAAIALHLIDSMLNSPKATPPKATT